VAKPYINSPWLTASLAPDRMAVISDDSSCTYTQLTTAADRVASGLMRIGITDGQLIASDLPAGPRMFALALACLRYGFGFLAVPGSMLDTAEGRGLLAQSPVRLFVESLPHRVSSPVAEVVEYDGELSIPSDSCPWPRARAGYLSFFTSGTTGIPQLVTQRRPWYSYRGVAVMSKYAAGLDFGPHIMANPTPHLGTFGPALYALQAGSTVIVQADWSPEILCDLIAEHLADSVFLSPNLIRDVLAVGCWPSYQPRAVFHGGSSCAPAAKRDAIELMGPVLHEYYGTSEGIITEISTPEWLRHVGAVGRPMPGVQVSIRADGRDLPPGAVGHIAVGRRGSNSPATASTDSSSSGCSNTGMSDTGDFGYLEPDGYLHVVGRMSSATSPGLAVLEHKIRSLPNVLDAIVISVEGPAGDRTICHAEVTEALLSHIGRGIEDLASQSGHSLDIRMHVPGSLPRTQSGKLHIAEIRKMGNN
jgi:long-chain acyl-CoA synthetase